MKVKVIERVGDLKDQNAVERSLAKAADELGFKSLHRSRQNGMQTSANRLTDTLQTVEDFNAIYCSSDFLLPTIMSCLRPRSLVPMGEEGVIICSIDGDPLAMDFITSAMFI